MPRLPVPMEKEVVGADVIKVQLANEMKKKYLIVGTFAFAQFLAQAQSKKDSTYQRVDRLAIEAVYNHYVQDGNNSAVTGGKGTEQLTVYGPSVQIRKYKGKSTRSFQLGVDVISSASTDNIDYVKSSASILDQRVYGNFTLERSIPQKNLTLITGLGLSGESDYFSLSAKVGISKEDEEKGRSYSILLQAYRDDLRWIQSLQPVKLIYPVELRYKEWYNTYLRNSYNLKLGFSQIINKRNIAGIYPELTYQEGLLATPFHRVYFTDGSVQVEQFPDQRWKGSLAIKLNSFIGGRVILKNSVNPYTDSFGILAISLEHETAVKLNPEFTLLSNVRWYKQRASMYFKPYEEHLPSETYFTSDYDLSDYYTYQLGVGAKYNPVGKPEKKWSSRSVLFRYNFLHRSNGLDAHMISVAFLMERN